MSESKFKKGEKVRIVCCPIAKLFEGEIGVIDEVVECSEEQYFYKVKVNNVEIANYASEKDLEKI